MARETQKIIVMGLGYIGLPTASMLATKGHQVLGVDVNQKAVDTINSGRIHIVEPDLDILVRSAVNSGNLHGSARRRKRATPSSSPCPRRSWKSMATPRRPTCSYVEAATRAIAPHLTPGQPGHSRIHLAGRHHRACMWSKHHLSKCAPSWPARSTPRIARSACCPATSCASWWTTTASSAASTKAASDQGQGTLQNLLQRRHSAQPTAAPPSSPSWSRTRFATSTSPLPTSCRSSATTWASTSGKPSRLANRHPRVNILQPGPGVGGHCIAVDPWFIVSSAPERGAPDPHRARGQRQQAAMGHRQGARQGAALQGPGDRLPGHHLQGQHRRHARVPLDGHRQRAAWPKTSAR